MGKMPDKIKIWRDWNYTEKKPGLESLFKKGDEISISGGSERQRHTYYKVMDVSVNCIQIQREDSLLAEKRQELSKDLEKKELLGKLTARELQLGLLDGGHPKALINPESGETWRHEYLKECRRRGAGLLQELGWPTNLKAKYFNRYTGHVVTLQEELDEFRDKTGEHRPEDKNDQWGNVWAVIEHWLPAMNSRYSEFVEIRIKYLERNKGRAGGRSKKQIRENQEKIQQEIDATMACRTFDEYFKRVKTPGL